MEKYQENIIPATNQNALNYYVHKEGSGVRVLFVGNSITKHAPKPEIGWTNDCGMAASSIDKDYVHILERRIGKMDPDAAFALLQVASYECGFFTDDPSVKYRVPADFRPDIAIFFFGANVDKAYDTMENPPKTFETAVEELRNTLDTGTTSFYISDGFYIRPVLDAEKKRVAKKHGDCSVSMEDIRSRDDSHGRFNHPGDLGMQLIADRFFESMEKDLENRIQAAKER